MKKPKEQWDATTRERLTLIALSYAEISIGRAVELLGWPHDKIAKRLKEYTGATLPDGQYPSYQELREVVSKLLVTRDGVHITGPMQLWYIDMNWNITEMETMCSSEGWVAVCTSQQDAKLLDYPQINPVSCFAERANAERSLG